MTKNIGKSIRTRLLNLAKEEKQEYMKVLVRYLHERLLFRISTSPYKSHFLLKGSRYCLPWMGSRLVQPLTLICWENASTMTEFSIGIE